MSRDFRVEELSWWIETGAREVHSRITRGRPVDLRTWSGVMRELEREHLEETHRRELWSRGYDEESIEAELARLRQPANTLRWVWSTIIGNPFWGQEIRDLVRSPNGSDEPIELFPEGTLLVILLKPSLKTGGGQSALADWHNRCAVVRLWEPLRLHVVKRGRLECASADCDLWLFVEAGRDLQREVDRLRLNDKAEVETGLGVEVFDRDRGTTERSRCIVVRAHSLNQAFGMASGRFESHRMSHGGRIYEHVYHLQGDRCVSLDRIRDAVELGGHTPEEAARTAAAFPIDVPMLEHLLRAVESHPRYARAPSSLPTSDVEHRPPASGPRAAGRAVSEGIPTDDIRKGMHVALRTGRIVEVMDDRRGNVRRVRSDEGDGPESADMYAWEFVRVHVGTDQWLPVALTADQLARRKQSDEFGM